MTFLIICSLLKLFAQLSSVQHTACSISNVKMYSTCVVLKTQEHSLCIIFTQVNINHLYFLWKCVRLLWQSVLPASGASHVASCCHGYSQCSFTVVYWSAWTNEPWAMARYEIISFSLTLEKCWVSAQSEMFVKLRRYGIRVEVEVWLHLLFFFVPSWLNLTENLHCGSALGQAGL